MPEMALEVKTSNLKDLFFLLNGLSVFLSKPFNSASRVHKFLFSGIERMTIGTDLYVDLFLHALRFKNGSAGTFDDGVINLWVNILFHLEGLLQLFN